MAAPFLSYASLATRWLEKLELVKIVLIGIDGLGGSGKSTLARRLAAQSPRIEVVHVDDFYLPSGSREAPARAPGGDYDLARLRREVLEPLRAGQPAQFGRYDWGADAVASEPVRVTAPIVIIEGVYALTSLLRGYYDESLWVECPRGPRLERGLARDGGCARARWVNDWMPKEDAYVALERPGCAATWICSGAHERADEGIALISHSDVQ
jgi:uridine kinase